jgi:hypothetical protein
MALTNLMPWGRGQSVTAPGSNEDNDPFSALSRDMNRLLDDFTRGFGVSLPPRFGLQGTWPHVEVSETDKDVTVVAELPGMDEKQGKRCSATLGLSAPQDGWSGRQIPGHQLVDAFLRPAVDEACQQIRKIGLRIDTIEFAGLDQ